MSKEIRRFEDLIAWQQARVQAREVFNITRQPAFKEDTDLRNQLRSAATSAMSNIAEGFERVGAKDFCRFLLVAKASCAEVRSLLYLVNDIGYIAESEFSCSVRRAEECGRVIGGLRMALRRSQKRLGGSGE